MKRARFTIGNGVYHEKYGDGNVFCGYSAGDTVMVKFISHGLQIVKEDELTSKPSIGMTRSFNRGRRQYDGVFSKKGSRKYA